MDIDADLKNCKYPERAIAFMDYMMSEHGQMLIYLGVEGVTYDIVDGKPVLKEDVSKILNSDRETYDRLYGADDAYWMLQNNVMQLQWEQKAGPATEQLLVWACKYTVYNGQYDVSLSTSPEIAAMDENVPNSGVRHCQSFFSHQMKHSLMKYLKNLWEKECHGLSGSFETENSINECSKGKMGISE